VRDATETLLVGAQIMVTGMDSAQRIEYDGTSDPLCRDLPPGEYTVTAALPRGYGLTTSDAASRSGNVRRLASRHAACSAGKYGSKATMVIPNTLARVAICRAMAP